MGPLKIQELHRTTFAALFGGAVALLFCVLHLTGALRVLEYTAYDLRFQLLARPELASKDIVVIDLDDVSFEHPTMLENFGRWPWRRRLYAQLLWYLRQAPVRTIGIDITFQGRDEHQEIQGVSDDRAFAEELGQKPDTVLAFALTQGKNYYLEGATPEYPELRPNTWSVTNPSCGPTGEYLGLAISLRELDAKARGLGCITMETDSDGVVRRVPLFYRYSGAYYPSLPLAVAAPFLSAPESSEERRAEFVCASPLHPRALRLGPREIPLDRASGHPLIYWYGVANRVRHPDFTFRHYSVLDVFNSALALAMQEKPPLPPSEFKDKIVLIGASAASLADSRPTPMAGHLAGVEIHATLISNLLQGHFVHPAGRHWEVLAILLLALGTSLAVWRFADWRAYTGLALALGVGFLAINFLLFYFERVALALVAPVGALAAAYATGNVTRYVTEGREKKRYRSTLMKYVSPAIVEAMMSDFRLAELHNEKRDLSVLFSDVRGFTSISEKYPVEQLVATLNEFLNAMVEVIFRNGGTLDKFVGDCVMAFWGAPLPQENHAELAGRAALEMQKTMEQLNQRWKQQGRPELKIGVGVNSGEVIFGNIGSERRMDFTVIGDNVNLASRLESATKELKAGIVISDATYQRIKELAEVRDLGTIHVKGKDVPIRVYELLGMSGKSPKDEKEKETYASAQTSG